MADVQFLSELFSVILKNQMQGFDQNALDALYAAYDDISEDPILVEDDFVTEVDRVKGTIAELQRLEPSLSEYFKVQSHFYTLWSYLHLEKNQYPGNAAFGASYKQFLDVVSAVLIAPPEQADKAIAKIPGGDAFARRAILEYARNVRGASTDLTPRTRRYEGLHSAIHGEEDIVHEDC